MRRKTAYIQREFIAQPLEDRCKQTVQLLQDIHLMMHADYFVGAVLALFRTCASPSRQQAHILYQYLSQCNSLAVIMSSQSGC